MSEQPGAGRQRRNKSLFPKRYQVSNGWLATCFFVAAIISLHVLCELLQRLSRYIRGQLHLEKNDSLCDYDNKLKADDYYLLKNLVRLSFIPQVKLQKNTPVKQQVTSVHNDYEITYTYDFQNNLPAKKRA